MLAATLGDARAQPLSILCLGAHSDDIEIGCGGTLLRLLAERPGSTVPWVVFSADDDREAEARGERGRRSSPAPASAEVDRPPLPRELLPVRRRRDQGRVRAAFEARVRSRRRLHASTRRRAPGPPHARRAHLEHVPRPRRRRVRDPQVRGRSRVTRTCTFRSSSSTRGAKDRAADAALRDAAEQALVPAGDVPGHDGAPRRRVQRRERLGRGAPRRKLVL